MTTTLERIEQLELFFTKIESAGEVVSALSMELPNLKQEVGSLTREAQEAKSKLNDIFNYIQMLVNRQMSAEQTTATLGKTLSALVQELEARGASGLGGGVMSRIRRIDEESERYRVGQLVQLGVIKESETVTDASLIVLTQKYVRNTGEEESVAEFRVIEMSSQVTNEAVKGLFVGQSVGFVHSDGIKNDSGEITGTLFSKVEKVFEPVQKVEMAGEQTPPQPEQEVSAETLA